MFLWFDQPLKRKNETAKYNLVSSELNQGSGYSDANSPLQTPVSGKAGKAQKASRTSKANRSASQTAGNVGKLSSTNICFWISDSMGKSNFSCSGSTGSPSSNNVTPVGPCRYDSSLGNQVLSYSVVYWLNACISLLSASYLILIQGVDTWIGYLDCGCF